MSWVGRLRAMVRHLFGDGNGAPPPLDEVARLRDERERRQVERRIELLEREAAVVSRRYQSGYHEGPE